jgi:hypothetical protein
MDVADILRLLATLSIGLDDPSDSDIVVFMRYLNYCYFELLQDVLTQSPLVTIINESLDCNNGNLDSTSQPLFIPKAVYDISRNLPLTGTTFDDVIKKDPGITKTGQAQEWYYSSSVINVYPKVTSLVSGGKGFGVWYIAQPLPLQATSSSSDILIPAMYQQILADGAAYHLFQSETGFKDQLKMQAAMARWQTGKQKLFAYMKNISGKKYFSTYSPV